MWLRCASKKPSGRNSGCASNCRTPTVSCKGEVARRVALQVELERQAATDLLTSLPNRRALAERFPIEAARAQHGRSVVAGDV